MIDAINQNAINLNVIFVQKSFFFIAFEIHEYKENKRTERLLCHKKMRLNFSGNHIIWCC